MRRAIYTGLIAFNAFFKSSPDSKLIAHPDLQEVTEKNNLPVDLGLLRDDWTSKEGRYQAIRENIQARALDMRSWLKERPEKEVAVVSHGAFLHFLTNDWEDACKHEATSWANTEHRIYEFVEVNEDLPGSDEVLMRETTFSRQRRGKSGLPSELESQGELQGIALDGWIKQGYPVR